MSQRQAMINPKSTTLSVREQCKILNISRSGYYHSPATESALNLELMQLIDAEYTKKPYYGSPRLTEYLKKSGYSINIKRIKRLMRVMGIEAIYQKPRLSVANIAHKKYPYLLKGLTIDRPNLVWCSDITYIPMTGGFMYLVAIMDWYSRFVLSWELSNTMDSDFCVYALKQALDKHTPLYSNTDQGSQFTSLDYVSELEKRGVKISMDGKGRCIDNIMIERLWRSLKYEDIYIHRYETVQELYDGLTTYFKVYNHERLHQSLNYKTPAQVFSEGISQGGDCMLN